MMSTCFPETFTRSIFSCMKIVEKKEITKWFVVFFIWSIKPFSPILSHLDSQLIHIHTFTVTSTKFNAKMQSFLYCLNTVYSWIWLKGHFSINVQYKCSIQKKREKKRVP